MEIKFILMLLKSSGIETTLTVIINADNVGAIFIAENKSATSTTWHVDLFIHQFLTVT